MNKNYIQKLQKYRNYYFDIHKNIKLKIAITKLEKELYDYTNEYILNNDGSYINIYLQKKLYKNHYIKLKCEYYENEELYELIEKIIKEREILERF